MSIVQMLLYFLLFVITYLTQSFLSSSLSGQSIPVFPSLHQSYANRSALRTIISPEESDSCLSALTVLSA